MNLEENQRFEEELRKARPVAVRPEVKERIAAGLRAAERRRRMEKTRSVIGWAGLALAASILITFGILLFNGRLSFQSPGPERPQALVSEERAPSTALEQSEDGFRPVFAENNLKNRIDEGIVFLRNGLTARRYRYEFVDRVVWRNPVDGAVLEVEIPRDEVVLVPVQTF